MSELSACRHQGREGCFKEHKLIKLNTNCCIICACCHDSRSREDMLKEINPKLSSRNHFYVCLYDSLLLLSLW